MKLPQTSFLLVVLVVVATLLSHADGFGIGGNTGTCKYEEKGTDMVCDVTTDTKWVVLKLKRYLSDAAGCHPSTYITKRCDDFSQTIDNTNWQVGPVCKWRHVSTSNCDATLDMTVNSYELIRHESDSSCPRTKVVNKPCWTVCEYSTMGKDGACDSATKTKPVTMHLTDLDNLYGCAATKVVTKDCNDYSQSDITCKYRIKVTGKCNPYTKMKEVTHEILLEKSHPNCEPLKYDSKPCDFIGMCRYKRRNTDLCDVTTDTKTETWALITRKSDPSCQRVKHTQKPCSDIGTCKWKLSRHGVCDHVTNTADNTYRLIQHKSPKNCPLTKVISKPCEDHNVRETVPVLDQGVPTVSTSCTDSLPGCIDWGKEGYCRSKAYGRYMETNCKRTCNLCGGGAQGYCDDTLDQCADWVSRGFCTGVYAAHVTSKCRRSCNTNNCGDCSQAPERGSCRPPQDYTRYYFNPATNSCDTFFYSGCGGNANNHANVQECERRCVYNGGLGGGEVVIPPN